MRKKNNVIFKLKTSVGCYENPTSRLIRKIYAISYEINGLEESLNLSMQQILKTCLIQLNFLSIYASMTTRANATEQRHCE